MSAHTPPARDGSSRALAAFVVEASVPRAARHASRRALLDWLGSVVAGSELQPPTIVREVARELGGSPQATLLPDGERTSVPLAGFANAAAAHVLEMDDLDRGSISHPGAPIIAAAVATAEQLGADGDALLEAIAVGYEVSIRVGEALGPAHYEYWHTTGTAGTLGAAAAVSRLRGLDEQRTLHAIGSAGTMAAGLWEFLADTAMSKQLHPAKAAHDGALAAILAARGFTAATRILEGPKGILRAMTASPSPDRLTDGLAAVGRGDDGVPWRIEGVSFKVHASCRHTHPAVDAVLELRAQRALQPSEIERVDVRLYSQGLELLNGVEPSTPYAAKFSLPFCVAAALIHGDLAPRRFSDDSIADETTLALAARVSYEADAKFDAAYPERWGSSVCVTMRDGTQHERSVDSPAGDPERPLTDGQLIAKFVTLTAPLLGDQPAVTVGRSILEEPSPPDARTLTQRIVEAFSAPAAPSESSGAAAARPA